MNKAWVSTPEQVEKCVRRVLKKYFGTSEIEDATREFARWIHELPEDRELDLVEKLADRWCRAQKLLRK